MEKYIAKIRIFKDGNKESYQDIMVFPRSKKTNLFRTKALAEKALNMHSKRMNPKVDRQGLVITLVDGEIKTTFHVAI